RWRVAVPNKPETCTGLPDPVKGTQCTFSCNEGEFLDMRSQKCQKCAAGTYSLGTGVAFDEWDSLPTGFVTQGMNMNGGDAHIICSNSTWTPKGDYIVSNTDECTATLSYAVSLKKPGSVSFEYFYPDSSVYFEFFVQNDQCQSTDSESRSMSISENKWNIHTVSIDLSKGNNVLYWRTITYSLQGAAVEPVQLRNIAISGVAYTSECFHCKPGTHSAKEGSAHCSPCPADSYSTKGATVCHECSKDEYAGMSGCKPRPACTDITSVMYSCLVLCLTQTQLMYKWIEPKICSETVKGAEKLPSSGKKQTCPPCFYSNGTACAKCPVGTEPLIGFEYKWWNTMPSNMRTVFLVTEYVKVVLSVMTAWEVAGEYIYTAPGDQDRDFLMLTLDVPGYSENTELSRITFVFDTECSADCKLYFQAGYNRWNNDVIEQWKGRNRKQSYSYLIQSNSTVSFIWTFQRTEEFNTVRHRHTNMSQ
uniref:Si:ch211-163l21.8 n=1 Tax=Sphaeramia orbicularis TaxID=375764 RepID=A0A673CT28_9TELE